MTSEMVPQACDLIVSGAVVVTGEGKAIGDGAVAVTGKRIVALGETKKIDAAYTAARRIDAKGKILMPGLVNVHNHTPLMIVRGMVEDLGFAPPIRPAFRKGIGCRTRRPICSRGWARGNCCAWARRRPSTTTASRKLARRPWRRRAYAASSAGAFTTRTRPLLPTAPGRMIARWAKRRLPRARI